MATFREMSTEIQQELGADGLNDLEDEVDAALNRAIADYQQEPFAQNYGRDQSITTTIEESDYTVPSRVFGIDAVQWTFSGTDYKLQKETIEWYVSILSQQTSQVGPVTHYVVQGRNLFLYPAPTEENTLTIWGTVAPATFTVPDDDAVENFWTSEQGAFQLIKARAKWDLYNSVTNDPVNSATEEDRAKRYLRALRARLEQLDMVGHYRPRNSF